MPRASQVAIKLGAGLLALLALLVLLAVALLVFANTGAGHRLIERAVADATAGRVRLEGLQGTLPGDIELRQLQIHDAQGPWITARGVVLHWSPRALLRRRIRVDDLQVERVEVARRPQPAQAPPAQNGPTRLPMRLDVRRVSIPALVLEPALTGSQTVLSVQGDAHAWSLEDAHAQLQIKRINGDGFYTLQLRMNPQRIDARLQIEEPAGGPLEHLAQWPGLGPLSAVATLQGPRAAEAAHMELQAGPLRAHLDGVVDTLGRAADLQVMLQAPAMQPRPDLGWQRADVQGRVRGTLQTLQADGHVQFDGLRLTQGIGIARLAGTLHADQGVLTVQAAADDVALPGPQRQLLRGSPLKLDATLRLAEPDRPLQLSVVHRLFALQARALTTADRRATFELELPDLAPWAALVHQPVSGRATLRGDAALQSAATRIGVQAAVERLSGPSSGWRLLGPAPRLQLTAVATPENLTIEHLLIQGSAGTLSVEGTARRSTARSASGGLQAVALRWRLEVASLSALSAQIDGTCSVSGTIDGPLDSLTSNTEGTARVSVRDSPPGTVQVRVLARGLPQAPVADVQAQGTFDGAPLQLEARVQQQLGNLIHLEVRHGAWKSVQAQGDLTAATDLSQGQGSLRLRVDRLSDLERLIGTKLQGRLDGDVALTRTGQSTRARIQLVADQVKAGDSTFSARLAAEGSLDAMQTRLEAQWNPADRRAASISATAIANLAARDLQLQGGEVRYRDQPVRLLPGGRVTFAQTVQLDRIRLQLQHATLTVQGRAAPDLDLRASLEDVDAPLVDSLSPGLLERGRLDAELQLHGRATQLTGTAKLTVKGLQASKQRLAVASDLPAFNLKAEARIAGDAVHVDAVLDSGAASTLHLTGRAPLNGDQDLSLKLTGRADAGLINPLLDANGQHALGAVDVNMEVRGSLRDPQLGGTLRLRDGDFRNYGRGVHLAKIEAQIVGDRHRLRIESMTARAGEGAITVSGTLDLDQAALPVDLRLTASNAQPVVSEILTATVDAELAVTGSLRERLDIAGSITLNRAVVGIPNSLPPDVAVLDVRTPGQVSPAPPPSRLVAGLDIALRAPRGVLVQGRGLDAQLGGQMRLSGTTDNLQVAGGFDLIRGNFALSSTRLIFSSGRVSFNGAGLRGRIDPTLDFTAQATAAGATVTLHILGFADAPKFELSSTPTLPQDEILARLLFGESAAQLSTLQVAELGAALASLSGSAASLNPLNKVQKALGLNRLSVGSGSGTNVPAAGGATSGTSGANVTAGRYVTNRVYVGATQSTTGVTQVEVQVDLNKHLQLQSRIGNGTATAQGTTPENDPGSSIGISYRFEY